MINKVTNTRCRSKIIFFLLTLYKSLKNFFSGTSNAIFFSLLPFTTVMDKKRKMVFWGAPCRQDEHQVLPFYVKMLHFFSFILVFYPRQARGWYFWRKAPERVKEQEFTVARFKTSPIFGQYLCFLDEFLQEARLHWNKSCVLKVSK